MRAEWRGSADEYNPVPERIASDVQHQIESLQLLLGLDVGEGVVGLQPQPREATTFYEMLYERCDSWVF
jgi:hypothetical protein